MRAAAKSSIGRVFLGVAGGLALVAVVGMAVLWPGETDADLSQLVPESERAEVVKLEEYPCQSFATDTCANATIEILSGEDAGEERRLAALGGAGGPLPRGLSLGDEVRIVPSYQSPRAAAAGKEVGYTLSDYERRAPMLWLAIAFAALVIAFGRLRGALSLVGLAASLLVILLFVIPAILDGKEPLPVALIGSLAVMLLTIVLAHGLLPKSLAAIAGTGASLLLVALLAMLFTDLTHLTGLSSEEAGILAANGQEVSFKGLLLAGMLIAALGVLDDVTISQASTVMALRRANPSFTVGRLYSHAIQVGRDHVSATVNTLVMAYVGSSLPILLIFGSSSIGFVDAVNVEVVAQEIVATLVGSIGLIAAVPLTTLIASILAVRLDPAEAAVGAEGHAH